MTISDDELANLSDAELKKLAKRATDLVRQRGIDNELRQNLRPMVQHLISAIAEERKKPESKRRQMLDFSVTQKGFYSADEVLATPGYKEAVEAISEKYGVVVEIYQGTTSYSCCGHMESDPDARVRVDLAPVEDVRGDVSVIMDMIKDAS